jgi:hypothetical protein
LSNWSRIASAALVWPWSQVLLNLGEGLFDLLGRGRGGFAAFQLPSMSVIWPL